MPTPETVDTAAPALTPTESAYDAFSNAFDELTAAGDVTPPTSAKPSAGAAPPPDTSAKPEAATPATTPAPVPGAVPADPAPVPVKPSTPSNPAAAPPSTDQNPLNDDTAAAPPATPVAAKPATPEVVDWKAKFEELAAQKAAAPPPAAATPAPAAAAPPPAPEPELYSTDEQEFLGTYNKEWADVIKGETLRRRAEYQLLVKHIFAEVAKTYNPLLQRAMETADNFDDDATVRAIQHKHSDYDDAMYDAVSGWVDKDLAGFQKVVAQNVIKNGSPQDVADLISEYKKVKGIVKPNGVATPAPAAPPTELPTAAKKAAQAMGVVSSKRGSGAPASVDKQDFDAAWAEANAA